MAKTLVILNPISGHGAGARLEPALQAALREGGLDFDLVRTTGPRDAIALAERAKRAGCETLVAVGGDGTVNEVVNGLARAAGDGPCGRLGILPIGSGNDLSKMLTPRPGWREGIQRLLAGRPRQIDLGRIVGDVPAPGYAAGAHCFVNAIDTGFGAQVATHAHDFPFLRGLPMYLAAVFKTLVRYTVPRVRIDLNDDPIEQPSTMVAIANGRCVGGGFWIAPTASLDDGLLDVIVAKGLGRIGILSLLPKVMRGTHIGDPRVRFARGTRIVIDSPDPLVVEADGEIPFLAAHHLEIDILPRRLQVLT